MNKVIDMSLHDVSRTAKKTVRNMQNKARNKLNKISNRTGRKLSRTTHKIQRQTSNLNKKVHRYVQKEPLSALALAVSAGTLLGLLLRK